MAHLLGDKVQVYFWITVYELPNHSLTRTDSGLVIVRSKGSLLFPNSVFAFYPFLGIDA